MIQTFHVERFGEFELQFCKRFEENESLWIVVICTDREGIHFRKL